jgi:hypothetical protein
MKKPLEVDTLVNNQERHPTHPENSALQNTRRRARDFYDNLGELAITKMRRAKQHRGRRLYGAERPFSASDEKRQNLSDRLTTGAMQLQEIAPGCKPIMTPSSKVTMRDGTHRKNSTLQSSKRRSRGF